MKLRYISRDEKAAFIQHHLSRLITTEQPQQPKRTQLERHDQRFGITPGCTIGPGYSVGDEDSGES